MKDRTANLDRDPDPRSMEEYKHERWLRVLGNPARGRASPIDITYRFTIRKLLVERLTRATQELPLPLAQHQELDRLLRAIGRLPLGPMKYNDMLYDEPQKPTDYDKETST